MTKKFFSFVAATVMGVVPYTDTTPAQSQQSLETFKSFTANIGYKATLCMRAYDAGVTAELTYPSGTYRYATQDDIICAREFPVWLYPGHSELNNNCAFLPVGYFGNDSKIPVQWPIVYVLNGAVQSPRSQKQIDAFTGIPDLNYGNVTAYQEFNPDSDLVFTGHVEATQKEGYILLKPATGSFSPLPDLNPLTEALPALHAACRGPGKPAALNERTARPKLG